MANILIGLRAAIACCAILASDALAQTPATVDTVASYPSGTFLENMSVGPDGDLLITSYLDRTILTWSGSGAPSILTRLDVHPVGVLSRGADIVLSTHGVAFTEGPAFTASNGMLVLARDGSVVRKTDVPGALFLNGLVELAPDVVLVADSLAGRIWAFDPDSGAIGTWLDDPLLLVDPSARDQRPGANGLKVHDGWLYVSNSSRGAIYRVRLDGTAAVGAVKTYATTGPVDDFAFLPDGAIAAATHGDRLIRVGTDGASADILGRGCDGCTSVTAFGPAGDLIVLTTGNLLDDGGGQDARVLRVSMR